MRQFTIAERLIVAGLLPLAALVIVHFSMGVLAPYLGLDIAGYAEIAAGGGVIALITAALWALGKSIARPLVDAADSLDAMAAPSLAPYRLWRQTGTRLRKSSLPPTVWPKCSASASAA